MIKIFWKKTSNFIFANIVVVLSLLAIIFICIGSIIFHFVEWRSYMDSFYFIVMTITTIWYWDYVPLTQTWKLFTMLYAVVWIPFFVSVMWFTFEARFKKTIKLHLHHVEKDLSKTQEELKETEEKIEETNQEIKKQETKLTKIIKSEETQKKPRFKKIF